MYSYIYDVDSHCACACSGNVLLVQSSSIVARAYHSALLFGMHAELEYVSLGCNRTPHAADWSSTGLLAYGASQSVALAQETEVPPAVIHSSIPSEHRVSLVSGGTRAYASLYYSSRAQWESKLCSLDCILPLSLFCATGALIWWWRWESDFVEGRRWRGEWLVVLREGGKWRERREGGGREKRGRREREREGRMERDLERLQLVFLSFCYMQFSVKQELSSHTSSVTCVTGQHLLPRNTNEGESPPIRTLIASASGDSTLIVWERPSVKGEILV